MSSWMKSMQVALKKVKGEDAPEPESDGCSHDHEVGIVDGDLRKIYFLGMQLTQRSKVAAAQVLTLKDAAREAKLTEAAMYDVQADVLREVFWIECRTAFPVLWSKPNIGIRKGWKLVWCEHPPAHISFGGLEDLLASFGDAMPEGFGDGNEMAGARTQH